MKKHFIAESEFISQVNDAAVRLTSFVCFLFVRIAFIYSLFIFLHFYGIKREKERLVL